jgi:hypothetical protein
VGIGDGGLGIGPNPQSTIPNPQSPITTSPTILDLGEKYNNKIISLIILFKP